MKKQGNRFIFGGDFIGKNINWGSSLNTTKGREAIKEHGRESVSTGKPSYWPTDPTRIPDLIDFYIIKNISTNFLQIEEGWDMNAILLYY